MDATEPHASEPAAARSPWLGVTWGALLVAALDLAAGQLASPPIGLGLRARYAFHALALTGALGLLIDVVGLGLARRRALVRRAAAIALGTAASVALLDRIYVRQGDALLDGTLAHAIRAGLHLATGLGLALAPLVGRLFAERSARLLRALPVLVGTGATFANLRLYPDDYHEAHAAIALGTALLAGPALASLARATAARARAAHHLAIAGALALALAALAPVANDARLALFRSPCAMGAWVASLWIWRLPATQSPPSSMVDTTWLTTQTKPPIPPSRSLPLGAPVVVLVTIDALRADVVGKDAALANLPTFARLRREAATFERARSPGSQTAVSLSTLFSGRYFSELRWGKHGRGKSRFDYPADDPTPRLAHLLEGAGVRTTKVASLTFLRNEFGVAPGFGDEIVVTDGRRHAHAQAVVQPLLDRLRTVPPDQPAFFYAHLTEPHAPYDRGRLKTGPPFERYRSEVVEADMWLGRVLRELASPALRGRAMLIVTADHGEAFGEHGTTEHTKTLYEELVRVPLFVWAPGVVARAVETPVGLVDLAPTVLDVFGLETPAAMKGQSIVPILRGGKSTLTRPLLAEGRLRRALWVGDRKVIVDERRHLVEAFDLASDPGELVDRSGDPAFTEPLVATLNAFFAAHALTADGYTPPYKP